MLQVTQVVAASKQVAQVASQALQEVFPRGEKVPAAQIGQAAPLGS